MTKFQETIVALTAIRNSLERTILCLYQANGSHLEDKPERIGDQYLLFTLNNHLQILLCSFLEEWSKFGGFAKTDKSDKVHKFVIDSFNQAVKQHQIGHFERAVFWMKELNPQADEAMLCAAMAHDI
jgi:hypothetical protein